MEFGYKTTLTGVYFDPFRARGSIPRPAVIVVTGPSDSWNGTWALMRRGGVVVKHVVLGKAGQVGVYEHPHYVREHWVRAKRRTDHGVSIAFPGSSRLTHWTDHMLRELS